MSGQQNKISIHLEITQKFAKIILILVPSIFWSFVKIFIPKRRKNVAGQLALITGGSEGIGRAIAIELAKEGCNIAIANRNFEKGNQTAEEIRKIFNVDAKAFKCDVGNRDDVKKLKKDVNNSMGIVDILVNNAGIMPVDNSLLEGDEDYYQYCVDVNMTSWIWTTRAFLPDMIKKKHGHIVGISSLCVKCPIQNMVTYAATKFANSGFMEGLQQDLLFYGYDDYIKTSTVYAGFVKTNDDMYMLMNTYFLEPVLQFCEAETVGKKIVDKVLKNCNKINIGTVDVIFGSLIKYLPKNVIKLILLSSIRNDKMEEYMKLRKKMLNL